MRLIEASAMAMLLRPCMMAVRIHDGLQLCLKSAY